MSSSWAGPNGNRPIIRGRDGDRIRILSNAGAALDVSTVSFDHAVPIDALVIERVAVLRGPAARSMAAAPSAVSSTACQSK